MLKDKPIIIITGATASGKSAYAIELAKRLNGVIINADAMQLYVDAPILTAQPNIDELSQISHQLYGILQADDVCDVARYIAIICPIIELAWLTGKTPMLVGGTGMYLKAMMQGIAAVPPIDIQLRAMVRKLTLIELLEKLQQYDPDILAHFKQYDVQRLARALEVVLATGKSLLWWQRQPTFPPLPDANFQIYVKELERVALYERINHRFVQMVANGGLAEAEMLQLRNYAANLPLMRAVGIRQLLQYFNGECCLDSAIIQGQAASRQYAKRQLTWIRNQWTNHEIIYA
jgi:tRNA dimethylallyltransferase